jgi:hypothetical protein
MAKRQTKETRVIERLLEERFPGFPAASPPQAYRYNPASIRVRLVHPRFEPLSRSEREDLVLPVIRQLPDETQSDITILLLLAPEELDRSLMNREFEHPTPSRL